MGEVRDLPTSAESAIKIDETCRDLRVAFGKIIFTLQQLGLCRGDIQEVSGAVRVSLPCGFQSGLILRSGTRNIDPPTLGFAIGRQRVVDLFPSPQNYFLKRDGRFPLS